MSYEFEFTKQFRKDLIFIAKGEPKRVSQIQKIIKTIKNNPQDRTLHYEKIEGCTGIQIRYLVGKKYRILIEIIIENHLIIFKRVGRRENFY